VEAGINSGPLKRLFRRNRVLPPERQRDLLTLLELVANRLANAHEQPVGAEPGRLQVQLGRAVTFIEAHLAERLTLPMIARRRTSQRAAWPDSLRKRLQQRHPIPLAPAVSRACELLKRTDRTCAEIAFEVGFGSVQHFNRIFRRLEEVSPCQWRRNQLARAASTPSSFRPHSSNTIDKRPV